MNIQEEQNKAKRWCGLSLIVAIILIIIFGFAYGFVAFLCSLALGAAAFLSGATAGIGVSLPHLKTQFKKPEGL
jgi:membrane associated rhomboid family serine protease